MAKINLLPWRDELRVQRNQEFGIIVGIVAAMAIGIVAAMGAYYGILIDAQKGRNAFLENEISKLDEKIEEIRELKDKKERLLQRIMTIQELQTNRTEIVHLFDETVKSVPDGVYLTSMKQSGRKLSMTGVAESNARVSEFVGNIEKSEWMKSPEINIITRNKTATLQTNNFTIHLQQDSPSAAKDGDEDEEGG